MLGVGWASWTWSEMELFSSWEWTAAAAVLGIRRTGCGSERHTENRLFIYVYAMLQLSSPQSHPGLVCLLFVVLIQVQRLWYGMQLCWTLHFGYRLLLLLLLVGWIAGCRCETMSRKCLYAKLMRSGLGIKAGSEPREMKQWQHEHASLLSPCRGWVGRWWLRAEQLRGWGIVIANGRYFNCDARKITGLVRVLSLDETGGHTVCNGNAKAFQNAIN